MLNRIIFFFLLFLRGESVVTKSALSFMKFFSFNSVKNLWKIVILKICLELRVQVNETPSRMFRKTMGVVKTWSLVA